MTKKLEALAELEKKEFMNKTEFTASDKADSDSYHSLQDSLEKAAMEFKKGAKVRFVGRNGIIKTGVYLRSQVPNQEWGNIPSSTMHWVQRGNMKYRVWGYELEKV